MGPCVPRSKSDKDPQKQQVYKLEGGFLSFNVGGVKLPKLRQLIRLACELYSVPHPGVRAHKGGEWSYSNGVSISFNKAQMNHAVALHEATHHIVDWTWPDDDDIEHHGREFQGIYQWLLTKFGVAPEAALRAAWETEGLTWGPMPPHTVVEQEP